jgi:translation initiation factor 2 subunit 1
MFYKKKGFPEINDVVMCTVKRVLPNSVFVNLDEYGKEGMVHISEVSPGRIRNIRDYVVEGRKIVCKVLRINREREYIDLSLRRVNLTQRRKKIDEYKQEMKAEKLLENVGKELKLNLEQMYGEVGYKILDNYNNLTQGFQDIINNNLKLIKLGIKEDIANKIEVIVKEKMKPSSVFIGGIFKVSTKESNGIEIIKKILNNLINSGINITYLGAPKYKISLEDKDYKKAEKRLKDAVDSTLELAKKLKAEFEFSRKNA